MVMADQKLIHLHSPLKLILTKIQRGKMTENFTPLPTVALLNFTLQYFVADWFTIIYTHTVLRFQVPSAPQSCRCQN